MRPVVEAAQAWRTWFGSLRTSSMFIPENELANAVDAWRAAQPDQTAPTDRPPSDLSQDQGADDGAGTEGSQAPGGAQGVVSDGYGSEWLKCSRPYCALEVVRPGKVQCDCEHAGNEEFPAPADPAGLDAAIEAAARTAYEIKVIWGNTTWETTTERNRDAYRRDAARVVRAAAPHLRAAALNEAADAVEAEAEAETIRLGVTDPKAANTIINNWLCGIRLGAKVLRERADQAATR